MSDPVMSRPSNIAVVVLAAGWSSRMGALKPLLPFGNDSVLGHVLSTIEAAAIGPAYVVVGNEAGRVAPAAVARGAVVVANPAFAEGMMSSIKAGISALPDTIDGAMILPVDVPLVRASTLERVAERAGSDTAAVLRPTFGGRAGHPPFVHRRLFAEILAAPPETTLRDVIERHQHEAQSVVVVDSGIVRDMDYPDDYRRLAAALPHRLHPDEAECEAMLEVAGTPEPTRRHSRAVARLAVDIATRLVAKGHYLDVAAVRAGALLHDIAKGDPDHAAAGARRVAAFGFAEVAEIVAVHMGCALAPGETVDPRHVVCLADKLVKGERLVGIEERFAPAFTAFASDPAALAGVRRRHAAIAGVLAAVETVTGPLSEARGSAELVTPAGSGE